MVIQNIIFPDEVCDAEEMYFRIHGNGYRKRDGIELQPTGTLTTDTYMNVLDLGHWKTYTQLQSPELHIWAEGSFVLCICRITGETEHTLFEQEYTLGERQEIVCSLPGSFEDGLIYFRIKALTQIIFYQALYEASGNGQRKVLLAVDLCTFHRNHQLAANLRRFAESLFCDRQSELYDSLHVCVVDNGDDFEAPFEADWLKIFRNSNQGGGTGGFTRGLAELKKQYGTFPFTHVVFMDDDVEFQMESFYRLYAFLALMRPEYTDRSIAGRMFRLDQRNIQYTAVEKWNQGNILHVGGNLDMNQRENLQEEKEQTGEYGGWWLCVFPAEIVQKYKPFPFFLHCDDVEYGLRQKKDVLTLRGFQVWHETYEYRVNPQILYYDVRNALTVNAMLGVFPDAELAVAGWRQRMGAYHANGKRTEEFLCALAMWHFGKRKIYKCKRGKLTKSGLWFSRQIILLKAIMPVFHRLAERYIRKHFENIMECYQKEREEAIWQ